jgi:uncharacterized protein (DUF1800 family)
MSPSPDPASAAIAMNRFGLGARPDEAPPADPAAWLRAQLDHYDPASAAWASEPDSATLFGAYAQTRQQENRARAAKAPSDTPTASTSGAASGTDPAQQATRKMLRAEVGDRYRSAVDARVNSALVTPTPFVERLVHFWANHFAVSTEKPQVAMLAGAFEREAIRPHVLGRFEDMLVAVEQHPAMQFFLDQSVSVGPDSPAAMRAAQRNPARPRGLNENLAREIMELHTLGVRSGYTQQDVTEFARALTGWSVANLQDATRLGATPGTFVFRPALHEPGSRTVLGRRYDDNGEGQARAVLHDLAVAPATAKHVATQLARHVVGDQPPPALVERLAARFTESGGDLPTLYRTLIDAPEAWSPAPAKFKTPWDWTLSAMRGLGWREVGNLRAAPLLTQLGQPVWRPGSPAGYDDLAASWAAPDALVRRVEVAQRFAARAGDAFDPRALGAQLLPGTLGAPTAQAIARAESTSTALALLMVSPDFLRR